MEGVEEELLDSTAEDVWERANETVVRTDTEPDVVGVHEKKVIAVTLIRPSSPGPPGYAIGVLPEPQLVTVDDVKQ